MAQCTPKSFDLTGKVALITGASYGIGMAIAKAMAANGATIVFNDIKQELVDKGIAAYTEAGIKAHGYVCDVTDEDAVNAMVAKITEEVGHIREDVPHDLVDGIVTLFLQGLVDGREDLLDLWVLVVLDAEFAGVVHLHIGTPPRVSFCSPL